MSVYVVNKTPQLRRSVVVYLDLLGFREQVDSTEDGTALQELLDRLLYALERHVPGLEDIPGTWELKMFTDNIVIGYPIAAHSDGEVELGTDPPPGS